jgi:hypothetical protein
MVAVEEATAVEVMAEVGATVVSGEDIDDFEERAPRRPLSFSRFFYSRCDFSTAVAGVPSEVLLQLSQT